METRGRRGEKRNRIDRKDEDKATGHGEHEEGTRRRRPANARTERGREGKGNGREDEDTATGHGDRTQRTQGRGHDDGDRQTQEGGTEGGKRKQPRGREHGDGETVNTRSGIQQRGPANARTGTRGQRGEGEMEKSDAY